MILFQNYIYRWKLWKNVIIIGANMSLSVHIDNEGKDILILGEGPTQGLNDTTLTGEAKYVINFTQSGKIRITSTLERKQQFFIC